MKTSIPTASNPGVKLTKKYAAEKDLRSTPDPQSTNFSKLNCTNQMLSTLSTNAINRTCTNSQGQRSKIQNSFYTKLSSPSKSILRRGINSTYETCIRSDSCMRNTRKRVKEELIKKYAYDTRGYDKVVVNDIIKNKSTHMTSVFKEYLVFDEPIEFMKRLYTQKESSKKLIGLTDYYNAYFRVFPNFILIPEKYYMYKNIERKQRVIDDQQYRIMLKKEGVEYNNRKSTYSKLFNESYKNHISTFRSKFNKEEVSLGIIDPQTLFDPRKASISSSYSKDSVLLGKTNNSLEMMLSRVNTSCMHYENIEVDGSSSLSFIKNRQPSLSISQDFNESSNNEIRRSIRGRKSKVLEVNASSAFETYKIDACNSVRTNIGLPPPRPINNTQTSNISKIVSGEGGRGSVASHLKRTVIDISNSLASTSPKNSSHCLVKKDKVPQKSPEESKKTLDFVRKSSNNPTPVNSKNDRVVKKNKQNVVKYNDVHIDQFTSLKSRLKQITNKKYSPNKRVIPYSNENSITRLNAKHTKNKRSQIHSIKKLCESNDSSKSISRNMGVQPPSKGTKATANVKNKNKFEIDVDRTSDNLIIFSKKSRKPTFNTNSTVNKTKSKRRIKNKRVTSYVVDKNSFSKLNDKGMTINFDKDDRGLEIVIEEPKQATESKHSRIKSVKCTSPMFQVFTSKKASHQNQRKSVCNMKDVDNQLICKSFQKLSRRVIGSLSLPKSYFGKDARLSYDASDNTSKFFAYKSSKGLLKKSRRIPASVSKGKKAASKLSRHIENSLGYKSVYEKNLESIKKTRSRHPNLPLPNIYTK